MCAALTKKNTLKQTGFDVDNLGLKYRNKHYRFDDVVGIKIVRHVLETKVIGVGSEFDHSISIIILVKSGEHIQVTEQPTWLSNSKLNSVEHIERMFSVIAQKSWNNRLNKYIEQVKNNGYYEYDGWRFYTQKMKIQDLANNKTYDLNATTLSRYPTYLVVKEKNEGLGIKIFKSLVGKEVIIGTMLDTDVFFTLFKHYFKRSWSQSNSAQSNTNTTIP